MQEAETLLRNLGVRTRTRFAHDNDYGVMSMVSAGLGFSVLPGMLLENAPFPLTVLPPRIEMHREISIGVRSAATASAATRAFVQTACAWVRRRYECS